MISVISLTFSILSFLLIYWQKELFNEKMKQLGVAILSYQFQAILLWIASSLIFVVSSMAGPLATILSKSISVGVITANILNVIAMVVVIYALNLWHKK